MIEYKEGHNCPKCAKGVLEYPPVENCSCHICPPCSACVNNLLTCSVCGWTEEEADGLEI